jgi:serine/threonine-protein kinase
MPQCAHCSTPIPDDARFCHSCGSQVSDAEGQARASASMDMSSFQHMEKLLKEDTTGEFDIQGMLGRGGMAVVFLATEIKLGRKVAIKVLPPELTFGHGVDRFMREAKTAAALDHPNIIPIYRIGSGGKLFWYAMKFLEGRSLDDLIKEKGKLTIDETIPIMDQVGDALDYAHQHNVIHRDMKPANVMLDSRNRVIVTDFGIAKALTEQTLTASGSVVGTPYYMSPEQGMGTGVSGRSDQYSVAVMAYRMLSGQFPFEGDSAIDILHKHCMIPPSPLEFVAPGLPKHVYLTVHKALEKKPERRFSSVSAFAAALREPTAELEASSDVGSDGATIAVPMAAIRPGRGGAGTTPPTPVPAARSGAMSSAKTVVQAPATPATPAPRASAASKAAMKKNRPMLLTIGGLLLVGGGVGGYLASRSGGNAAGPPATQQAASRTAAPTSAPAGGATPTQPAAQPTSPATPAPTTGQLTVSGLPRGGSITVDGRRERGTQFDLSAGRHEIRIEAAGFAPITTPVTIEAGRSMTLPFTGQKVAARSEPPASQPVTPTQPPAASQPAASSLLSILRISVQPPANLSINNVSKGQLARIVDTLPPGTHVLHFQREGYLDLDTAVTLKAGQVATLLINLVSR